MHYFLFFLFVLTVIDVRAQYDHEDVLIGQSGELLIDQLISQYKPVSILDYNEARDTMFSKVYAINDSVSCVYTGHKLFIDPSNDPSTVLHKGGIGNGINTEHTFPQSKGAGTGNARSNMHHLFPVRSAANSARNNFPYGEIDDSITNTWYYKTLSESNPTYNLDEYSELDIQEPAFEPREDHKGNVSRAVFYFYSMYKQEADDADPSFFAKQLPTLCQWHIDDPVDSLEWIRNYIIADYQEGKVNPFILDCSLPYRTYCPYLPHNSCYTSMNNLADFGMEIYQNYPNPANQYTYISYALDRPLKIELSMFDATGQLVKKLYENEQSIGLHQIKIDCINLPNGLYTFRYNLTQNKKTLNVVKKLLVIK